MAPALTVQNMQGECGSGLDGVEQTVPIISLGRQPPRRAEHNLTVRQFLAVPVQQCTASDHMPCASRGAGVHAPGNSLA